MAMQENTGRTMQRTVQLEDGSQRRADIEQGLTMRGAPGAKFATEIMRIYAPPLGLDDISVEANQSNLSRMRPVSRRHNLIKT